MTMLYVIIHSREKIHLAAAMAIKEGVIHDNDGLRMGQAFDPPDGHDTQGQAETGQLIGGFFSNAYTVLVWNGNDSAVSDAS